MTRCDPPWLLTVGSTGATGRYLLLAISPNKKAGEGRPANVADRFRPRPLVVGWYLSATNYTLIWLDCKTAFEIVVMSLVWITQGTARSCSPPGSPGGGRSSRAGAGVPPT